MPPVQSCSPDHQASSPSAGAATPEKAGETIEVCLGVLGTYAGEYILDVFRRMYAEVRAEGSSRVLMRFQMRLRAIHVWNSDVIERHTAAIRDRCKALSNLIAAAFVAYVVMFSSIKLHSDSPKIHLKLPTNEAFVHKAFLAVAADFYKAPQLVANTDEYGGMRAALQRTFQDMLPMNEILEAVLGNTVDGEQGTVSPSMLRPGAVGGDDADAEDDEDDDGGEDADAAGDLFESPACSPVSSAPDPLGDQPRTHQAPVAQPLQVPPAPIAAPIAAPTAYFAGPPVAAQVTQCETKTISIPQGAGGVAPPDDTTLFEDAADEGTDWQRRG